MRSPRVAGGCARTTLWRRSICSACAATAHAWPSALLVSEHVLVKLLSQSVAFRVVFVPSRYSPCYGNVFCDAGLTQSRGSLAAAKGFAVLRAVALQIQPHGVAFQLSSADAVPCLSQIPTDAVSPCVYAIQLRGTTPHTRDIRLSRSFVFSCEGSSGNGAARVRKPLCKCISCRSTNTLCPSANV